MTGKRGNGEGSVYEDRERRKRADGSYTERVRWVGSVSSGDGKRHKVFGRTREEVAAKLAQAQVRVQKQIPFGDGTLTLGRYLTSEWLPAVKASVRPKTYRSYEGLVRVHLMPPVAKGGLGNVRLVKLGKADIEKFLRGKSASSPRTRQYLLTILRMSLKAALENEQIGRNVAALVKSPRVERHEIQVLDNAAIERLLAAATGHRFQHLFSVLLGTGLRVGEALALTWSDVDTEHSVIRISHTLQRISGQPWEITKPKSPSGVRSVPMIGPVAASLRLQHKQVMRMAGSDWPNYNLVFPNATGNPCDATNVLHELKKILARAGLPTTTRIHDLRHACATFLLSAGVDGRVVMQLLGWSQRSMLDRYQHVRDSMLADAAQRLEAVYPIAAAMGE